MFKEGVNKVQSATVSLFFVAIALLIMQAAAAAAETQPRRYALAYGWNTERQRVTDYRQKIAALLGLKMDNRLKIVVRGQDYGLVWNINAPLAQAKKQAEQQNARLRRAGLKPARVIDIASFSSLHRVRAQSAATAAVALEESRKKPTGNRQRQPSAGKKANAALNAKIGLLLQEELRKANMPRQVRTGWAAYDLTANEYLVGINLNQSFQAASMIKPFVALAFFHQVDKGKASYTQQHRQMMEAMIQQSSNPATNWFIRQLGGPARCEALLRKAYGSLVGQIRIREYIPANGRTYLNSVQPFGYIQFLKVLWHNQVPNAKELLRVMALPGPDRLVDGTSLPGNTEVYDKTGTTALLCGDMGILVARDKEGRRAPYAVVGVVERSSQPANYKQWMQTSGNVIRKFSMLVHEEIKQKYNLQ